MPVTELMSATNAVHIQRTMYVCLGVCCTSGDVPVTDARVGWVRSFDLRNRVLWLSRRTWQTATVTTYRNTLKAHAHALSKFGEAFQNLASEHRVAASAGERDTSNSPSFDSHFADWIAFACEMAVAAERLLQLEIELARKYGARWEQIGDILGISRQAAWERFNSHTRWDRTHRTSQVRRTRRGLLLRRMLGGVNAEEAAVIRRLFRSTCSIRIQPGC